MARDQEASTDTAVRVVCDAKVALRAVPPHGGTRYIGRASGFSRREVQTDDFECNLLSSSGSDRGGAVLAAFCNQEIGGGTGRFGARETKVNFIA